MKSFVNTLNARGTTAHSARVINDDYAHVARVVVPHAINHNCASKETSQTHVSSLCVSRQVKTFTDEIKVTSERDECTCITSQPEHENRETC